MLNETLLSDLIDQLVEYQDKGDEALMTIVNERIRSLTSALESGDTVDNYRYLS